jgi:Asp-tRNA(Asn)/Glu-tRNA(Gln) amidotransferase A subunit family amidase
MQEQSSLLARSKYGPNIPFRGESKNPFLGKVHIVRKQVAPNQPAGILTTNGLLPFPDWIPFTYPWNLTGQPAAAVPADLPAKDCQWGLRL